MVEFEDIVTDPNVVASPWPRCRASVNHAIYDSLGVCKVLYNVRCRTAKGVLGEMSNAVYRDAMFGVGIRMVGFGFIRLHKRAHTVLIGAEGI
jgi:hypothetical protein